MATKTESMLTERPTEIALEAMRLLAKRREAPTPQAYQLAYEEIARRMQVGEVSFVAHVAAVAAAAAGQASAGRARSPGAVPVAPLALAPEAVPAPAPIETPADAADARPIQPANGAESGSAPALLRQNTLLRDLLMRTLTLAVAPMLAASPELAAQAEALGQEVRNGGDDALDDAATRLRQLCFKIGMRSTDMAEQQELLLRLFRLLLDNVSQLLDDDSWMQGQMAATNALLAGPLSYRALEEASRSLKEVVYKQSILKKGMSDAKTTVKKMMLAFIEQLSSIATTTGDFHQKIEGFSSQVSQASDIDTLNVVLEKIMLEAHATQLQALRTQDYMMEAKRDVSEAENRIQGLQAQLVEMSELVREDHLTGILNRRGLDDGLEQEIERAERRNTPLCVALLDLDDFKRLNDTHGHQAGDEVLVHLVHVIRDTLRSLDIIGRFGGEEFVIVLPNTGLDEACATVTRLQRELTERIFMHKDARLFITFSSGVAQLQRHEDSKSIIERADKALYVAKKAGKNRIVSDRDMATL